MIRKSNKVGIPIRKESLLKKIDINIKKEKANAVSSNEFNIILAQ
jgi:hypothetical protein